MSVFDGFFDALVTKLASQPAFQELVAEKASERFEKLMIDKILGPAPMIEIVSDRPATPSKAAPVEPPVARDPKYGWPVDIFERCANWARANLTVGATIGLASLLKKVGYGRHLHRIEGGASRAFTMRLMRVGFGGSYARTSEVGRPYLKVEGGHNVFIWLGDRALPQ